MKIDKKGYVILTPKESDTIIDLLYILGAMSGGLEDDFNKDCEKAQKIAERIHILTLKDE